jgi:hypothetical protein
LCVFYGFTFRESHTRLAAWRCENWKTNGPPAAAAPVNQPWLSLPLW